MKHFLLLMILTATIGKLQAASIDYKDANTGDVVTFRKDIRFPENVKSLILFNRVVELPETKRQIKCEIERTENSNASKENASTCSGYKLTTIKSHKDYMTKSIKQEWSAGWSEIKGLLFTISQVKNNCTYKIDFACAYNSTDLKPTDIEHLDILISSELNQYVSFKTDDRTAPEWP